MGKGTGPRIVKETKWRRLLVEPPGYEEHPWSIYGKGTVDDRVFLSSGCVEELIRHCKEQADKRLEALGFLVGGVFSWKKRAYTVVRDVVTTRLEASAISVRFDWEGSAEHLSKLDRLDYRYILVGWYHSHPGYGCFLSETDIHTQQAQFAEPFHVALVADPVKKEMKVFGSNLEELTFGIYDEDSWSWPGPKKKT